MSPRERGGHTVPYNSVYLNYLPLDKPSGTDQGCWPEPAPPVMSTTWLDSVSQCMIDEDVLPAACEDTPGTPGADSESAEHKETIGASTDARRLGPS